jgi:CRISPR-associated protein Cas5d
MEPKDQVLEVWGDFACFSRPEMKVERFSYPIITPSAARGIYDAIFSKPNRDPTQAQFRWQVTKIEVLAPPQYIALRRNEVKEKAPTDRTILRWAQRKEPVQPILADAGEGLTGTQDKGRTQRQTMALKDVRYRLHAQIRPWAAFEDRLQALEGQFRRRAAAGQCFFQPYFGCREFPAYFELVEPGAQDDPPIAWDEEIGLMLYDVFDLSRPGTCTSEPFISLFRATVSGGVLNVPEYDSDLVLKPPRGDA